MTSTIPQDWFTAIIANWVAASPSIAMLVVLIGLDISTGVVAAFITKKLSSTASFTGMLRKVLMLALVAVGVCMELIYPDIPWGRIIAYFFCLTEVISITENCARAGVPLPKQLTEALSAWKQTEKEKHPLVGTVSIDKLEVTQAKVESDVIPVAPILKADDAVERAAVKRAERREREERG